MCCHLSLERVETKEAKDLQNSISFLIFLIFLISLFFPSTFLCPGLFVFVLPIWLLNFSNDSLAYDLKYFKINSKSFRGEDIKINASFDWLRHNNSSLALVDRAYISYYSGVLTKNSSEARNFAMNIQSLEKKIKFISMNECTKNNSVYTIQPTKNSH